MNKAKCIPVFLVLSGLALAALAVFFLAGGYNVAANVPHWGITRLFLEGMRESSVSVRSRGISAPSLVGPEMEEMGLRHFHAMCRFCHGAPGFPRYKFAQGLYPSPPDLATGEVQSELDDADLYWIIKNGLKMTGMPAFGATHDEHELWAIVAVVKRLPELSADDYRTMIAGFEQEGGDAGHHY